jgi:hypothetical protein
MSTFWDQYKRIGGKQLNERGPEHEEVFGVEIFRVRQNTEDVAYIVLQTSGRRTIGGAKEHSIEKLGDDKAFEQAKKEALKIVRGWK